MKTNLISIAVLLCISFTAYGQKWSVSTNIADWMYLGTINAEASVGIGRHWTANAGVRYNPWTFRDGDSQFQDRKQCYSLGVRAWPWHIYSGWWIGGRLQYLEYNAGGIFSTTSQEGDAFGAALSAGYALMLHKNLNMEFGAGFWTGWKSYTTYACTRCGKVTGKGKNWFLAPNDILISLVYTF